MRPLLKPALRRLWRDRQTLQLGLDPRRAVLVGGLDPTTTRFVEQLDGTRDLERTWELAERVGLARAHAEAVLNLLAREGVLEDASGRPTPVPTLPHERARLGPDLTSLALLHGSGEAGLAALDRRARAVVAVHGAGRVGAAVAGLLAAAGVGHVVPADRRPVRPGDAGPVAFGWDDERPRRETTVRAALRRSAPGVRCALPAGRGTPDVAVLVPEGRPDPEPGARLIRQRVPHLYADIRETTGVIGPFVLVGRSACGRCLDLARSDRDPGWPRLLAQLAAAPGPGETPCDVVLATEVAARAALQVLTFLDGALPTTVDGTVEIELPDGLTRRRSWSPHPRCDCRATHAAQEVGPITHAASPSRTQWVA
ncbi:ThiF family adenylyltransferase [Embleya sp. NBC_00888]|uniref:ThiF family adenylyltransferase n=1 Tax=Embleya sp. NBC_00888 TaxID=2975960 RepID=UPI00386944BB|nr:ThiF family adenylyltransferase [Embleya sp. NBC_00888]